MKQKSTQYHRQKNKLRVCMISLGCPKNQVDSERALGALTQAGCRPVENPGQADALVVNTCAFIRSAEEETIQAVLEAAELKRSKKVPFLLVVGCWVAKYGESKLKQLVPEIDQTALPGDTHTWVGKITEFFQPAPSVAGEKVRHRANRRLLLSRPGSAYLKIAEGCSRKCSFCLIPRLRGSLQSRKIEDIVAEAKLLVHQGVKELILIAQDTTRYGWDLYGGSRLVRLTRTLAGIRGLRWIRLMYLNPDGISPELIELFRSEKKLCKYLDMPVQHVAPKVVRAMKRTGNRNEYLALIQRLRESIPDVVLRTTLLTGFPGETEQDHAMLMDFITRARFERLGVFAFSPEPGTPAAMLPRQVHFQTRKRRRRQLMQLQQGISRMHMESQVGRRMECMVEETWKKGYVLGRTVYDAPEVDGSIVLKGNASVGTIVQADITGATDYDLQGVIR